jgi:hypothetical protein
MCRKAPKKYQNIACDSFIRDGTNGGRFATCAELHFPHVQSATAVWHERRNQREKSTDHIRVSAAWGDRRNVDQTAMTRARGGKRSDRRSIPPVHV